MSTNFYEKECLPRVKSIAQSLDFLCDNTTDKSELEEQIEEITTEWQDVLFDALEIDEEIDVYNLEIDELLEEMEAKGIAPNETDIADYNDLCEQLNELENIGASNLYEYFEDCFDVEYTIDRSKELIGVCVWIAVGGPEIWVDTRDRSVKLAWGSERAEWGINTDTANAIEGIFEEEYRCL